MVFTSFDLNLVSSGLVRMIDFYFLWSINIWCLFQLSVKRNEGLANSKILEFQTGAGLMDVSVTF